MAKSLLGKRYTNKYLRCSSIGQDSIIERAEYWWRQWCKIWCKLRKIMVRSNFNKTYYFPCLSALFYKVQFKVNHSDWGDNDKQKLQINQCLIAVWDIFVASEGVDLWLVNWGHHNALGEMVSCEKTIHFDTVGTWTGCFIGPTLA